MSLTLTDLFCGAGGSAQGAHVVPGIELRLAANHWQLAVDSHAENFPDADHISGSKSRALLGLTCDNEACRSSASPGTEPTRGRTAPTAGWSSRTGTRTAGRTPRRSARGAAPASRFADEQRTTQPRTPDVLLLAGQPVTSVARPRRSPAVARSGASTPTTTTALAEPGAGCSAPAATPVSACSATTPTGSGRQRRTSKRLRDSRSADHAAVAR